MQKSVLPPLSSGTLMKLMSFLPSLSRRGSVLLLAWLVAIVVLSLMQLWLSYDGVGIDVAASPWLNRTMLAVSAVFFGLLLFELLLLWYVMVCTARLAHLSIERSLNNNLPIHKPTAVTLTLASEQSLPSWLGIEVMDGVPEDMLVEGLPLGVTGRTLLVGDAGDDKQVGSHFQYNLTPMRRGWGLFDGVSVRLTGMFGLWQLYQQLPQSQVMGVHQVRVFADFKAVLSGNLFAVAQKSSVDGMLRKRRRGQGQDFHQIRSYHEGDGMRQVDWRATSRLGRLMSREYQDEQEQEILFLIDSSQQMRHERLSDDAKHTVSNHLDAVLNAMLLIASLANKQGDATGFISFSGKQDKTVPPKKGGDVINYLLNHSFDIAPSLHMADYIAAARRVLNLQKKRSLIIVVTSTRSESTDELLMAVNLLRAKHLVLVANLYEEDLASLMQTTITHANQARTYHSVRAHVNLQQALMMQLKAQAHVSAVHCTPDNLAALLVSHYFGLKRAQHF